MLRDGVRGRGPGTQLLWASMAHRDPGSSHGIALPAAKPVHDAREAPPSSFEREH